MGKLLGFILLGAVAIVGLGIASSFMGAVSSVATAPSRVISKTMQTDNIINNYEWFHDANGQYKSRIGQIREYSRFLADTKDSSEVTRSRMELSAVRQSCRDLATRYNANATKSNRSIFMGTDTPSELNLQGCEQ